MRKEMKKEHRNVVKYIRKFNKSLSQDEYLGVNRFRIDIWSEKWNRFSDGSGGELFLIFKMTDKYTNNTAMFITDNYSFHYKIPIYLNDFLIRCSSGSYGHYPILNYVAYDIHTIIPYVGSEKEINEIEDGIIDKYSWVKGVEL